MWDNMKFQAEKEWGTQKLWVERWPLGKWQMCYLVIPQETYLCSVTSLDILSQDHFYKCKFLFTVTHITRPALSHELLMEFAMSTQGIWQSLFAAAFIPKYDSNHQICLLTHGLDLCFIWSIDLNSPVCSQVLEWLCLWFKKWCFCVPSHREAVSSIAPGSHLHPCITHSPQYAPLTICFIGTAPAYRKEINEKEIKGKGVSYYLFFAIGANNLQYIHAAF